MLKQIKALTPTPLKHFYRRLFPVSLLMPEKLALIDHAFTTYGLRSIADLGGVWRVEGGYIFHALARHRPERAVLVDMGITPTVRERQRKYPQLELINANFALPETAARVGRCDAVLLYDVLLHQVRPNWDEVLATYAPLVQHFIIYNQQFTGPQTVRLIDQGREWYLRHVPHGLEQAEYRELFERMHEPHPRYPDGRTYYDMHDVWQWGITDASLDETLRRLGFSRVYYQNYGPWPGLEEIENRGFIYRKD